MGLCRCAMVPRRAHHDSSPVVLESARLKIVGSFTWSGAVSDPWFGRTKAGRDFGGRAAQANRDVACTNRARTSIQDRAGQNEVRQGARAPVGTSAEARALQWNAWEGTLGLKGRGRQRKASHGDKRSLETGFPFSENESTFANRPE